MALQGTGSITATQIAVELGYTQGASTRIGDYRLNGGQDFTDGQMLTINNISAADGARVAGTYTNIGFSRSSGDGGGMRFTVIIDESGAATISILDGGVDNEVGDQIEIDDNLLGSGGGATLTFNVESISNVKLPISEGIPTSVGIGDSAIKFSDFYNARRTLVVDYYSQNENKPVNAKDRFDSAPKTVVGGFVGNDENTSGKKVVIVVNKNIGSDKTANDSCALRTGSDWSADTALEIIVGSEGQIIGAGGDGGRAGGPGAKDGVNGGDGSSGLGVEYEGTGNDRKGTKVTIQSGGRIAGGGGGGGGGGGAINRQEKWWGGSNGPYYGRGGFGGGGAGLPAGLALGYDTEQPGPGRPEFPGYTLPIPETIATLEKGGGRGINIPIGGGRFVEPRGGEIDGGPSNAFARGGIGGNGGDLAKPTEINTAKRVGFGATGRTGGAESENAGKGEGGQAGLAGAAIRRKSSVGSPVSIAATHFDGATGITTFTTSSAHTLVVGSPFRVLNSSDVNLGNFVVRDKISEVKFDAVTTSEILLPTLIIREMVLDIQNQGTSDQLLGTTSAIGIT